MIDYPKKWRKYMIEGKVRTFKADTPQRIVAEVNEINKKLMANPCVKKPMFYFENN